MRARVTSSHFVGRAGELAELERACEEAAEGIPALVLLGGDSGVGKTRLVGELEHRLTQGSERRTLVLRGEAVEQADGELPYAPLLAALRPLARSWHPVLEALGSARRRQLATVLPGLDDAHEPPVLDDSSAQLRLFEALLELLARLSEDQPVALILEDMHWADRSTRTFVAFLARSLRQERLAVVLTHRTDELYRRHPLRPLLSELERLERTRRLELEPFDRDELIEALTDILGEPPSDQLVLTLFTRSEGNPLYTEELLAAGLDGRGAAPQSLRDAFMLRIERLSADAQRAARAIAVGRALDEPTMAELTEIEHEALQAALREAVAEQVLVAGEDRRLSFRHALLREALYDDLLPGERGDLHLALAVLYEERARAEGGGGVELATAIASHYAAAGDQPAALRATVQAALAARQVHAYGEAADLAERALELWPRVSDAEMLIPLDHVELIGQAASAHMIAGDWARAAVLLESALGELDPDSESTRYAALLGRLARIKWTLNRGAEGLDLAQRALSMLPADDGGRERATLLAWIARTRVLRGRYRDALNDGEAALAAAVAAGDSYAEGEVLNTLGMAQIALRRVDEGAASLRRAMEIARAGDDPDGLAYAYANLADLLNIAGRTADALETAREGREVTSRHLTRAYQWITLTISELAFEAGDWQAARELGSPPSQLVGTMLIFRLLREAELALGVGDDERAVLCLAEVEPLVTASQEPQWIGALGTLMGELRRRQRELRDARAVVAHALDRIELCTDDVMRIARVSAVGARVEADIAQRARDLRERGEERDAIARARIHVQRLRAAAQEGGPVESAWRAVGSGELARARGRHDPAVWLKAAREWDAIMRPYQAAIVRWRAAEAHVEAGDRAAAGSTATEALRVARELGARFLEGEVTALADRARLELTEDSIGANGRLEPGSQEDPFGLTPRERQVLALIAEGATNRQIGAALYMAEKTASVHVSRILGKLGVRSRTQAAAVAHRMRLD